MKPVEFLGDSLDRIRAFPESTRHDIGFQLERVQRGLDPDDWKPMKSIGPGVREVRVRDAAGAFRVIYIATWTDARLCSARIPEEDPTNLEARFDDRGDEVQHIEAERATMKRKQFDNVWDAVEPTAATAASMKARARLMMAIREAVEAWEGTQATAAKRLGLTQPRMNDLLRGRISKFSLDALLDIATRAGLTVRVDVRRTAA
jgi:predicted XRE-type DNA-binding protein